MHKFAVTTTQEIEADTVEEAALLMYQALTRGPAPSTIRSPTTEDRRSISTWIESRQPNSPISIIPLILAIGDPAPITRFKPIPEKWKHPATILTVRAIVVPALSANRVVRFPFAMQETNSLARRSNLCRDGYWTHPSLRSSAQ